MQESNLPEKLVVWWEIPITDRDRRVLRVVWQPYTAPHAPVRRWFALALVAHLQRLGIGFELRKADGQVLHSQTGKWAALVGQCMQEGSR